MRRQRPGGQVVLLLRDRRTGRPLWRRQCEGLNLPVAWSTNRRALALSIADVYQPTSRRPPLSYSIQFRLLYWRAGHPPRLLPYPGLFTDFDEVADMRWSPDGRRFAFLAGSTALDTGRPIIGVLCCVNAVTGHFFFGPGGVGRYRWVGPGRLQYVVTRVVPDPHHPKGMNGIFAVERPRSWAGTVTTSDWKDPDWLRGKARRHGRLWPW